MRKKLKELPEGDWLCEECKFRKEIGHEIAEKPVTDAGALEVQHSTKSSQNNKNDSDAKCLPELDTKALESVEKGASNPQVPAKECNLDVDQKCSKDPIAQSKTILHEGSLSNLGADKTKQVKATENGGQSTNNPSFARSHTFSGPNSSKIIDASQTSRGKFEHLSKLKSVYTKIVVSNAFTSLFCARAFIKVSLF